MIQKVSPFGFGIFKRVSDRNGLGVNNAIFINLRSSGCQMKYFSYILPHKFQAGLDFHLTVLNSVDAPVEFDRRRECRGMLWRVIGLWISDDKSMRFPRNYPLCLENKVLSTC